METEYIEKQAALDIVNGWRNQLIPTYGENDEYVKCLETVAEHLESLHAADVRPVPPGGIGEMSDGYHTFNGLYYQRKVLFASLVNAYKENAWKSYRHEDGELCFGGGWFIVGVETPKGNYTYHYENKDFDLFDCKELPVAPHWDGHTEGDVTRLLSLPDVRPVRMGRWKPWDLTYGRSIYSCTSCVEATYVPTEMGKPTYRYCPNCGAEMEGGESDG